MYVTYNILTIQSVFVRKIVQKEYVDRLDLPFVFENNYCFNVTDCNCWKGREIVAAEWKTIIIRSILYTSKIHIFATVYFFFDGTNKFKLDVRRERKIQRSASIPEESCVAQSRRSRIRSTNVQICMVFSDFFFMVFFLFSFCIWNAKENSCRMNRAPPTWSS